jgi:hypothetical protein
MSPSSSEGVEVEKEKLVLVAGVNNVDELRNGVSSPSNFHAADQGLHCMMVRFLKGYF